MIRDSANGDVGHNSFRVEVVKNMEQLMQIFALRAICFMEDTGLPYDHAFDGNDLQATHVVGYDGIEPVGTLRIRWFKDFAKIERTAFRPRYRDMNHLRAFLDYVFNHIARKGYSRAITHASPKYARLWRIMLGMKRVDKPAAIYFGEEYIELVKELEVPANAITGDSDVEVLFRTEGAWDVTGRYETAR